MYLIKEFQIHGAKIDRSNRIEKSIAIAGDFNNAL